jgi:hypothetical protein
MAPFAARLAHPESYRGGVSIECERCRQGAVRLDLSLQIDDLLLGDSNRIRASDESAGRRILGCNGDEGARELCWVS